jgi:hypothetical protein
MTWTYITTDFEQCIKIVKMGRCAGLKIDWIKSIIYWKWFFQLKYIAE